MGTEIQQNRYDQLMRRVGGLLGPGAKVAEILSELFPVMDVERLPAELYLLSGTVLGYGGTQITAAAGQFPAIELFNPVDSGNIATVTSVFLISPQTSTLRWSQTNTALTNDSNRQRNRDSRRGLGTEPICTVRSESKVVSTAATGQIRLVADNVALLTDPNGLAVLGPGVGLEFGLAVAQSQLFLTFHWRERTAEQSELNF